MPLLNVTLKIATVAAIRRALENSTIKAALAEDRQGKANYEAALADVNKDLPDIWNDPQAEVAEPSGISPQARLIIVEALEAAIKRARANGNYRQVGEYQAAVKLIER